MDAAQKLIKNFAILPVFALLLAVPGWSQTLQVNSTTATVGNLGAAFVNLSSSDGTTTISFNIATSYTVDTTNSGSWLVVNSGAGTGTTQNALIFTLRGGSAAGVATNAKATVTLTPTGPAGVAATPVTITVTFNGGNSGGGGGGTSNILTASANPVTLTAPSNSSTSTTFLVSTSSISAISLGTPSVATTSGNSWLGASLSTTSIVSGQNVTVTVTGNSSFLSAGVYQGTVTIQPSSGTALTVTVNFNVGGAGSGAWTTNPTAISLSTTGTQSVPVTATNSQNSLAGFNVSTNSFNNWLVLSTGTGDQFSQTGLLSGATFTPKIGAGATGMAFGTYVGQVIVSDASGPQATVTVNLTVGAGNSAGLTLSPTPLPFSITVNGASQTQTVTVTSTLAGAVTVLSAGSVPAWLSATAAASTIASNGGSTTFTVTANPAGFGVGTYFGALAITSGGGQLVGTLPITLVIGTSGTTGTGTGTGGTLSVAPSSMAFAYQLTTSISSIARQKLAITGPVGAWSSSISGGNWLTLSPSSGNALPDPAIDGQAPVVTINPSGLSAGTYAATISIFANGSSQAVSVSLSVVSTTILVPTPGSLIFSAFSGVVPSSQNVFFSDSDANLNFTTSPISAVANSTWISLTVGASGLLVSVNPATLGTGVYSSSITVTQSGAANSPLTLPVVLVVNGGGNVGNGSGSLIFTPSSLSFTSTSGSIPAAQTMTVSATSTTSFIGSIAYSTAGETWLTVSPLSSTTNATLSASASPSGLAAGTHSATISFNANGTIQTVPVSLIIATPAAGVVTASPTSLTFSTQAGVSPGAQPLAISSAAGSAAVTFAVSITAGNTWLSTSANAQNSTPTTLTVSINATALTANTYSGNIRITPTGGTAVDVPVTLTVTAPPTVSATPVALAFTYRVGDAAPIAQTLAVAGTGLAFTVTAASTPANWLVATPATGTGPGTVSVSVAPTGLNPSPVNQPYTGTVTVAGSGGAGGTTTVNVTLTVTAPLPTLSKVTNGANFASGAISPGEIVSLFALDQSIGPATPVGLTLDSTGKVATTLGGVQVLINGFACPLTFVSGAQINAVVPYEVKLFTTAQILVKFLGQTSNALPVNIATTAPALFTANSSGTGPGAILNSDLSFNTLANPAARGDVVVVYMTGEGETSPVGTTGKVTPSVVNTPAPLLPVSVSVGGQAANFIFAGEAPSLVSGVLQVNVVVPTTIGAGAQSIVVSIGGTPSQQGVTVYLK